MTHVRRYLGTIGERHLPSRSYNLGDKNAMNPHTRDTELLVEHAKKESKFVSAIWCGQRVHFVWLTLQLKVLTVTGAKAYLPIGNCQIPTLKLDPHSKALDSNRQVTRGLIAQLFQ